MYMYICYSECRHMNTMGHFTVVSYLLLVHVVYVCSKYQLKEVEIKTQKDGTPYKVFTDQEIAKFDGTHNDQPIYLAVKGVVFDVSKGRNFYNKQSDYNKLAGKDATRAHAMWSLEKKDLNHDMRGLTDDQLYGLDQVFEGTYMEKYPIVGYMDYLIEGKSDVIKKRQIDEL